MCEAVCTICGKPAGSPYRRHDSEGKIFEGCVDGFHSGHLPIPSNTAAWHNRSSAKKLRLDSLVHRNKILGKVK